MDSIPNMFKVATKTIDYGIEGYHVDNKYFDARRSKQQKILEISKDKSSSSITGRIESKKKTYIDDILKIAGKMPGPTTYDPKQFSPKQSINLKIQSPRRRTIFDEMQTFQKKKNYPAAGKYDKIEVSTEGKKLKGNLSKAQNITYLDNQMRGSIDRPGVGQYSARIEVLDHRGPKWVGNKGKKSESERNMKLPPVGTYDPLPIEYTLFDNLKNVEKKKSKSYFNREQRFKSNKTKAVPYYNVLSEWGMKDKLKKKDILSRIGSSLTHHSIYY